MEAKSTGTFSFPSVARGQGPWLYGADGRRFFDGTAGSGAILLGHQERRVLAAAQAQLGNLVHTGCKLNSAAREAFVVALSEIAPFQQCAVLPCVIGTEAVESALKVARAYTGRKSVIGFDFAFHGKSAGALVLTWRSSFKAFSALEGQHFLVAPHPGFEAADDAGLRARALEELRAVFERAKLAGDPPAALILEPIQVTEGVHDPGPELIRGVIDMAHEYGTLAILDEIYTGMGRCGQLFYSHCLPKNASGAATLPDLMTVGKALGNGFPISAVIGPAEIVNALPSGVQTSTFSGNPLSCAAARAVIDIVVQEQIAEVSRRVGERGLSALRDVAQRFPIIARVRGQGTLWAFDLVDEAGQPSASLTSQFVERALARGVFLFKGGRREATIKIVPPAVLGASEEDFLLSALNDTARDLFSEGDKRHAVQ